MAAKALFQTCTRGRNSQILGAASSASAGPCSTGTSAVVLLRQVSGWYEASADAGKHIGSI